MRKTIDAHINPLVFSSIHNERSSILNTDWKISAYNLIDLKEKKKTIFRSNNNDDGGSHCKTVYGFIENWKYVVGACAAYFAIDPIKLLIKY